MSRNTFMAADIHRVQVHFSSGLRPLSAASGWGEGVTSPIHLSDLVTYTLGYFLAQLIAYLDSWKDLPLVFRETQNRSGSSFNCFSL